ncbi:hypothetical protein ACJX0J_019625, partial [Zea mays]
VPGVADDGAGGGGEQPHHLRVRGAALPAAAGGQRGDQLRRHRLHPLAPRRLPLRLLRRLPAHAAGLRRRRARGPGTTGGASASPAAEVGAVQHADHGGQLRAGRRHQGRRLLRGAVPGGARRRLRHAQHDRVRRRPVRGGGEGRQAPLHLLQPLLPGLLRRRGRRADGRGLGADALRDGRRLRPRRRRPGRRAPRPRVRRGGVPQQAPPGQRHLHSHCKGFRCCVQQEEADLPFRLLQPCPHRGRRCGGCRRRRRLPPRQQVQ